MGWIFTNLFVRFFVNWFVRSFARMIILSKRRMSREGKEDERGGCGELNDEGRGDCGGKESRMKVQRMGRRKEKER